MTRPGEKRILVFLSVMAGTAVLGCRATAESPLADNDDDLDATAATVIALRPSSHPSPDRFGVGRTASAAEIAAMDIDIMPDGAGLPPGQGTVAEGAALYGAGCVPCHGVDLEGTPIGDRLVPPPDNSGFPDGEVSTLTRAIGNYWPYASTIFDYVRRAMPFDRPGSLSDDDVYALAAYLLWKNGIIEEGAVMNAETLAAVQMPARNRFVDDDRLESDRVR